MKRDKILSCREGARKADCGTLLYEQEDLIRERPITWDIASVRV